MAEAPSSLGDFFAKKNKKKIKGLNLNNAATTDKKEEDKKPEKKKNEDDDGWQEEEVVQATMKVEAAGKLIREEEKKEEEDTSAPAWGNVKVKADANLNEKRFPTLAKSVAAINMEDNSQKVNISTSKNMFANLEEDGSDDEGIKRPKEIKPAMVTKKKGEKQQDAVEREVGKFKPSKAKAAAPPDDEDDEEEEEKEEKVEKEVKAKKKKEAKVQGSVKQKVDNEVANDAGEKIEPDLAAAKAKYAKRRKLPRKELPEEEMEEEKENKPVQQKGGKAKKKWAVTEEEDTEKKLQYLDA
eukprot:TRINITY_DN79897_c0_g1_i1.p1 TRINITY_DN79897_c0_g1~~TRINITY_DN79897_c0_g1_i1.p1  ORF type:complete len:318 (+),score=142.68 TRINITY_DN79897_c0_g1_i1:61-954(+)